ncbi:MAG: cytochrome c oxidase subunit II [Acidobacteria bacterium]|nr:MAG: cytochrome c oxidase subunit II [Acidobacteriota bacterium]
MHASNALDPQSPQARAIYDLGIVSTIVFVLIFLAVAGAIVYAIFRFRGREGEPDPDQFAGSEKVEIIWTAIPFLIVVFLFVLTLRGMNRADPPPAPSPDLVVTGHQFWWEAQYPASGAVTANEIHIPIGTPLSVRLDSKDVLHEFWVPELARKMTTVPGQPNHIWLQADKPGVYIGTCSEFCGIQHAWMRILVVAEEPSKFEQWQQAQLQPSRAPTNDGAAKGLALFRTSTCINCHAIGGVPGANARVAPDLTHVASRRQLGAGILENTPANMRRWLKNPQHIKPGVLMPDFNFTDQELDQLGEYLETLR